MKISSELLQIDQLGELCESATHQQTIDNGDHIVNIWAKGEDTFISLQGTGESVTLLKVS